MEILQVFFIAALVTTLSRGNFLKFFKNFKKSTKNFYRKHKIFKQISLLCVLF